MDVIERNQTASRVSNALDDAFESARQSGRAALIPYITAGFPNPDVFVDLAVAVLEAGAGALEIGIPFSDPLLDGPSIQASQRQALDSDITTEDCLRFAREISSLSSKALLFMGAFNPILSHGLVDFCRQSRAAGVSAVIIPDLPFEEQTDLAEEASSQDLHLIQLVAPTTAEPRLQHICDKASGFVYCMSASGLTGVRTSVPQTARPLTERVRKYTVIPVAVGFGIAGPEQATEVAQFADGVTVGSAVINAIAEAPKGQEITKASALVSDFAAALAPIEPRC